MATLCDLDHCPHCHCCPQKQNAPSQDVADGALRSWKTGLANAAVDTWVAAAVAWVGPGPVEAAVAVADRILAAASQVLVVAVGVPSGSVEDLVGCGEADDRAVELGSSRDHQRENLK